ncbi:hypothetical protein EON67_11740, partial [archaeon]
MRTGIDACVPPWICACVCARARARTCVCECACSVGNRAPLVDSQYLASFSVNPLLHPATDKGQLLLKLPRKQVHDTAVMHAHIEATKFNGERAEEEA